MGQVFTDDQIKARILYKLSLHGYFGGRHTAEENLYKGFNLQHLGKGGHKRISKLIKELIKEGILIRKPTSYGLHLRLNAAKSKEIEEYIKKHFDPNI